MDDEHFAEGDFEIFEEPQDFRPPSPKPTCTDFIRTNGSKLVVHLPPKHSLWGHWLWNAAKSMSNYLELNQELYMGKNVLELGAAASVPSIICALNGAKYVCSTDYPDPALLRNIELNGKEAGLGSSFQVKGYIWGVDQVHLDDPLITQGKYDLILLADLIFNHNQHAQLLKSCRDSLADDGVVFVTFSHHNPKWADRDLAFFELSKDYGFKDEKIYQEFWKPMFPDDVGNEEMRATVHGYKLSLLKREE